MITEPVDRQRVILSLKLAPFVYRDRRGRIIEVWHTPILRRLLGLLEMHSRGADRCQVPLTQMARELRVSVSTASRAVAACEAAGLLSVKRQFELNLVSEYQINWEEVEVRGS